MELLNTISRSLNNRTVVYLLLVLVSAFITFLLQKFIITDEVLTQHLSSQLSIDRIEEMLDFRDQWQWLNYVVLPIIYLIKFSFITLWLLCGIILFGYKTSFKRIFRVVIMSEFVWIIPSILTLIWFGLIDSDYSLIDVKYFQPLSLMSLFDVNTLEPWLIFPLKALNFFEVIYMLVLALGLKSALNRDYNASLGFVVPVYGIGLITWIVFITFLSINLTS